MVLLLSKRNNKISNELKEILEKHGGNYISDKIITENGDNFTILSLYKKAEIYAKKSIAVYLDENNRFLTQKLPNSTIGICEENNLTALENLKYNNSVVITCGINCRNTITLSSISKNSLLATLQRTIIDIFGNVIYPCELKIILSKNYSPFAVMAAVAVLLLNGITPKNF